MPIIASRAGGSAGGFGGIGGAADPSYTIQFFVVAGGGAGSAFNAGGGGGGAYTESEIVGVLPSSTYTVTIGAGGSGTNSTGTKGSNSVFSNYTVEGGGFGGWGQYFPRVGWR
jgi:hypothetical protein